MAAISGENGAVYYNEELTDTAVASSIIYSTGTANYIITSSTGSGAAVKINFENRGYTTGMLFTLSGSSGVGAGANNRVYTINDVSTYVLTVAESLTAGTDTGTPKFTEADPGVTVLGFYNWSISQTGDVLETTNFDDSSGGKTYIPGLTGWTVTADKYFQTADTEIDEWLGQACEIRCFLNYVATPSGSSPSQYWDGDTVVTGLDHTTPVDALVTRSISFQGDRALTLKTQSQAWNLGLS